MPGEIQEDVEDVKTIPIDCGEARAVGVGIAEVAEPSVQETEGDAIEARADVAGGHGGGGWGVQGPDAVEVELGGVGGEGEGLDGAGGEGAEEVDVREEVWVGGLGREGVASGVPEPEDHVVVELGVEGVGGVRVVGGEHDAEGAGG